ncbi:MAG: hemerythrin domain-containing protein [Actinobacteria bacterium]|nr:hemerythrin domain-containing protein [Actinomycetota bacterium]
MPTREQVRRMLGAGLDYTAAADRLGIPAGQAYLIATGRPADSSGSPTGQEQGLLPSSQDLANPPHENPTGSESVQQWIRARVAADAPMRKAAEQRTAEPSADEPEDASTDVLMVLTRDHNMVRALVKQLSAIPGHKAGGTPEDESQRKSIVDMITVRVSRHEAAEEDLLWPAVRKALPDGDKWADGALAQEQEGKETLTALAGLEPGSDEFDSLVERLNAQLRRHVAYETEVFRRLREAMPGADREELGKQVLRAEKRAPARPHAKAPQQPAESQEQHRE